MSVVAALAACGGSHGATPINLSAPANRPSESDRTILSAAETRQAIDPAITGHDRDVLLSLIAQSPLRTRLGDAAHPVVLVLYDAKGKRFISNRVGVAENFEALGPVDGTPNVYRSRSGRSFVGPRPEARPFAPGTAPASNSRSKQDYLVTLDRNSGPYRRVYTSPNHFESGYFPSNTFAENAYITTPPCGSAHYKTGTRDAGYAYFGGWGNLGYSVDAGLQHTLPVSGRDEYQMFMSLNGQYLNSAQDMFHNNPFPHIACGTQVAMHFGTVLDSNGYLALELLVGSYAMAYEDSTGILGSYEWTPVCTGCVLKRMVSIAQVPEDLTNGSSFGPVTWQWSNVICDVGSQGCTVQGNMAGGPSEPYNASPWSYPVIGGCMEYPQWNSTGVPPPFPTDCSGTPNNGHPNAVQVNWQDAANETVQINLPTTATPPPAPTPTPLPTRSPQGGGGCGKNNCL
jgi:hypothetical protein